MPEIDSISGRGTQTPARFKDDLTRWIAKHPDVPFPSIKPIADSRLVYPRDQAKWNDFVGARPVNEDPATIRGARDEQRYRDAFTKEMDISSIDAVIFPSWTQLPPINGAPLGGSQLLVNVFWSWLQSSELTFVGRHTRITR